jgi:hypothetical protein
VCGEGNPWKTPLNIERVRAKQCIYNLRDCENSFDFMGLPKGSWGPKESPDHILRTGIWKYSYILLKISF